MEPNLTPFLVSLGHSRSLPRKLNVRKWAIVLKKAGLQ